MTWRESERRGESVNVSASSGAPLIDMAEPVDEGRPCVVVQPASGYLAGAFRVLVA
jgi:hypothetical protein